LTTKHKSNSRGEFEILLENSPIGIYYSDFFGKFLYGNKSAEEIVGQRKKDLIGKNFLQLKLLRPEYITKAAKLLALNRLGKDTGPDEFSLPQKDGTQKWIEITTRIIQIDNDKIVMGMVQDITQRKLAEEERRRLNRFNELKADIWKLAADQTYPDDIQLIQKLLDTVGPALDLSRASYLQLDKEKKAYVTDLQWRKKNVKSSIGDTISRDKAKQFFGKHYIEIPGDIDQLIKTPIVRQAVKSYAERKMKKLGIKNYLVVAFGNINDPEALFTFSECRRDREWNDLEKHILSELVNIVAIKTEHIKAKIRVNASLKEKEVMLKEIHHRVKNNMQIISSLLNIKSGSITDEDSLQIFRECQAHIRSMALLHERFYKSHDLANIDFASYIQNLTADLFNTFLIDRKLIRLETVFEKVHLNINQAIPCSLIVNELVSNALKHAFPNGRKGMIRLELNKNDDQEVHLIISDNGVGFPKQVDFRNTDSLGLCLVNDLVPGTSFHIRFSA